MTTKQGNQGGGSPQGGAKRGEGQGSTQGGGGQGGKSGSGQAGGTRGGTPEQHAEAGRQSHKNDKK